MNNALRNKFLLISSLLKGKFMISLRKVAFFVSTLSVAFFFILPFFCTEVAEASSIQNDKLIKRISKDYTNKFCNSVAFGLSKQSAMEFSMKENNLIFKNKKGIDNLDKSLIANKIAISVVEDCGYLVDLIGDKGIKEFENNYLSMID